MLRRGQTTTFQERLDIIERAAAGQSDPEIATALGCEVGTVRKWRSLGQHQGRLDLGGYDYYLGTSLRNQMLELSFDAT